MSLGEEADINVETGTYSQRPIFVFTGHMHSEFGQVLGEMHVRAPFTVVDLQLHLADCEGAAGDNVGSVKVNNGAVSISVGMVLVVCQFGHIVVPHTMVGSTTCPRVVPTQLQDHESAVVPLGTFGMTRAHLPYAVLVGGGQVVDEDVLFFVVELVEPVRSSVVVL